jgi:hypothetical protein
MCAPVLFVAWDELVLVATVGRRVRVFVVVAAALSFCKGFRLLPFLPTSAPVLFLAWDELVYVVMVGRRG